MTYVHSPESSAPEISLQAIALLLPPLLARRRSPYNTPFHQPDVAECRTLFFTFLATAENLLIFSPPREGRVPRGHGCRRAFPLEILSQILLGPQEEQDAASSEQPCDLPHTSSPSQPSPSPSSLKP
ncbi:hypothetical protein MA16_Dca008330 [Dendrobium catenatum]|uniref:Uncharacterized protein n=1 Tax=Dendrobium catenatum TaxID=906689 RepID=A0A2I0W834_9ASPA|nr:hypothetical protein MA16_Dca008330 [Dendrobium catenatum]